MLREEFIENVSTIADLQDFCNENGISEMTDDIYSREAYYDYLSDDLYERSRNDSLEEIRDWLCEALDAYHDYEYFHYDYGDYEPMTDDGEDYYFVDIKENILDNYPELFDDYEEDDAETDVETGEVLSESGQPYDYDEIDIDAPAVSEEACAELTGWLI